MNEEIKIHKIKELVEMGQMTLDSLKQAQIKLDSVKSWVAIDGFGGSPLISIMKLLPWWYDRKLSYKRTSEWCDRTAWRCSWNDRVYMRRTAGVYIGGVSVKEKRGKPINGALI